MYIKPEKIEKIENYSLAIRFTNNELKWLDVKSLDLSIHSSQIIDQLFKKNNFENVKIGKFGEIYWENLATMQDLEGSCIPCEFDMSPEYVYEHSL
ncbi:MAG: DUF2442 domain-containing protein [Cytophagales bacterium]